VVAVGRFKAAIEELPVKMERMRSGVALFYYIGEPDDDIQYQFIKQDVIR
jgi:hypothetical protein